MRARARLLGAPWPGTGAAPATSRNRFAWRTSFRGSCPAQVQEVRAWTITKGFIAPQAAGVIHSDFEKGFIRAEVIKYNDFLKYKSEAACRENGKLAVQGKTYIVEDGDIMHFLFNV